MGELVEPSPGVFTFEMLQPHFCELSVLQTRFGIMRPNTVNKYGVVLDDFGFKTMIDKLIEEFICPISRDIRLEFVINWWSHTFHVDDSEVPLNVCLGK
ncbi:hypothetical protein RchiOBHm_Chr6g0255821 [Rosa chinensis]|uniref:Uncharacterized protein n=1 Tax=Rosa chinensis TaxID=74649 RepID=A0A2P6PLY7_ROSCH|nr:hypothetical protein RchiOBHm_Chr6g0255821 [Rosa chinensis]